METKIRQAQGQDLDAVTAIVERAYSRYIDRMGQKPGPMLDDYATLIASRHVWVSEAAGRVLGILVLLPESGAMLVDNIAVDPAAQGMGLGRKMMDFAQQAAIAAGLNVVRLYTNEAMTENIALYCKLGFTETHRVTEKGLRRVYMEKPVNRSKTRAPFRVRCEACGTVAESWPDYAPAPRAPRGAMVGPARCGCGSIEVDALGPEGRGRIISRDSDARWQILTGDDAGTP